MARYRAINTAIPQIKARGMLRPGSRISSASGVTLVQPSYAQSTLTIAAMIPVEDRPGASARPHWREVSARSGPQQNGRAIKMMTPPTFRIVPTTWSVPPRRVPRTLTAVTTAMASVAAPACQISLRISCGVRHQPGEVKCERRGQGRHRARAHDQELDPAEQECRQCAIGHAQVDIEAAGSR